MSAWIGSDGRCALDCEGGRCTSTFSSTQRYASQARRQASEHGWSTRPASGQGARTAPDLCPRCRPDQSAPVTVAPVASVIDPQGSLFDLLDGAA